MTIDPTESGFTPAQIQAIRGQHVTVPAWLNPASVPPADLIARIDHAIEQLEELGGLIYGALLDTVRPVVAEYRSWVRDHPMPDEAADAVDDLCRYGRLDQLLVSTGQFVTYMAERLDDVPVLEAYGRVLQGDGRTVYAQVDGPLRGGMRQIAQTLLDEMVEKGVAEQVEPGVYRKVKGGQS